MAVKMEKAVLMSVMQIKAKRVFLSLGAEKPGHL